MRGLLACTVLVLVLGVIYAHDKDCVCDYAGSQSGRPSVALRGRLDAQAARLSRVSAKVQELVSSVEKGKVKAKTAINGQTSMKIRLRKLEGDKCPGDGFFCDDHAAQENDKACISGLLVCDGHRDCPNGYDENEVLCKVPIEAGTVFEGDIHGRDMCTQRKPYKYQFIVTSVSKLSYFTAHLHIKGQLVLFSNIDGVESVSNMPVVGHYCFSESKVVYYPPEDDRLAFKCKFDHTHPDICEGYIYHEQSGIPCVTFPMHRV